MHQRINNMAHAQASIHKSHADDCGAEPVPDLAEGGGGEGGAPSLRLLLNGLALVDLGYPGWSREPLNAQRKSF